METKTVIAATTCYANVIGSYKPKRFAIFSIKRDPKKRALAQKMIRQWKRDQGVFGKETCADCASLIQTLCKHRRPHLAEELLLELKCEGFLPDNRTLSAMMLCYADSGLLPQAQAIWEEMLYSSFVPSVQVYSLAISCFGKGGQLELMEDTLKKMVSKGFWVDSATGNAFVVYYSLHGSLAEMEAAYDRLKRSRLLIEREGIRAMSFAYIKERKFYGLSEFLRDVGLGRKNLGNLIWNLLLLSYSANFKMKTLQREFLNMLEAGFHPDLTTFNIRALAFSRMSLLWDLHLGLEHMKHDKVAPDLVTYGCIVDAYLDRRLVRNLEFALSKMHVDNSPVLSTDPFVFEVFGKGDFHSSSEAFMEFKRQRKWTYRELIKIYLRKQHRSKHIFWNY
uniref:Pentacotripeptide-repeat region of PRORP domain-containing protein n=1 Tax=Populus trichocarpa TaxID=3694 RepID=U5FGF9_POPTR|eukprot:XP_006372218.1 pentatricopeptide repeat-containing protein At3g42630 isoform X2 [Populus trichocarpa]